MPGVGELRQPKGTGLQVRQGMGELRDGVAGQNEIAGRSIFARSICMSGRGIVRIVVVGFRAKAVGASSHGDDFNSVWIENYGKNLPI